MGVLNRTETGLCLTPSSEPIRVVRKPEIEERRQGVIPTELYYKPGRTQAMIIVGWAGRQGHLVPGEGAHIVGADLRVYPRAKGGTAG
jgi:hypothetical protein